MRVYTNFNEITADDLLLLSVNPEAAKDQWLLRICFPDSHYNDIFDFVPLSIDNENDNILFYAKHNEDQRKRYESSFHLALVTIKINWEENL